MTDKSKQLANTSIPQLLAKIDLLKQLKEIQEQITSLFEKKKEIVKEINSLKKEDLFDESCVLGDVNNQSTNDDKIALFSSLFRGRVDVYARRWQNKVGRAGYSPICLNEWQKGICGKPKIKCADYLCDE